MAVNWPDIQNPSDVREIPTKAQIRSKFAAGYVQSMPKHTRGRKKFEWISCADVIFISDIWDHCSIFRYIHVLHGG